MRTKISLVPVLVASLTLPFLAAQQESLGDMARRLQQERSKSAPKAARAYTNDNLPSSNTRGAAKGTAETTAARSSEKAEPEASPAQATDKKTREYWQGKFKSAREELARAKELQTLAEDELNLLQIQDARLLDLNSKAELAGKIAAKQDEVSKCEAATARAQKTLDDLEDEFEKSGAPAEWSDTETESSE